MKYDWSFPAPLLRIRWQWGAAASEPRGSDTQVGTGVYVSLAMETPSSSRIILRLLRAQFPELTIQCVDHTQSRHALLGPLLPWVLAIHCSLGQGSGLPLF